MSQVREIVTKAIVGKGTKRFKIEDKLINQSPIYSVLGCWVINHSFDATLEGNSVTINGEFEINIWHSTSENSKTDVSRKKISYQKEMVTKKVVESYLEDTSDVIVKMIQQPTCVDAKIIDDYIEFEIIFEALAEVIGETKMQVTVFSPTGVIEDDLSDIDNEIDENSIK